MKNYFCIFDEKGEPFILTLSENRIEQETKNARYLTEEEVPIIQARMEELVRKLREEELKEEMTPEEFLQLIEENF